jgi:hypothetical protein
MVTTNKKFARQIKTGYCLKKSSKTKGVPHEELEYRMSTVTIIVYYSFVLKKPRSTQFWERLQVCSSACQPASLSPPPSPSQLGEVCPLPPPAADWKRRSVDGLYFQRRERLILIVAQLLQDYHQRPHNRARGCLLYQRLQEVPLGPVRVPV